MNKKEKDKIKGEITKYFEHKGTFSGLEIMNLAIDLTAESCNKNK